MGSIQGFIMMHATTTATPSTTGLLTAQLSPRELEVLTLIVEGRSNPEIAATLYLSPNTIKTHVRGIFNKFGVSDRVQAAVLAVRHQLV
jgi:two-component system, NarL family, response regulator LiaR